MNSSSIMRSNASVPGFAAVFYVLALLLGSHNVLAQHGHPLVGTWSGFLEREQGEPMRALVTMEFSADQMISGMLLINGGRFPFTSAMLDHESWTVNIVAEGQDRAGNMLRYELQGQIEMLDSPTDRTIAGTWQQAANGGDFRIVIN